MIEITKTALILDLLIVFTLGMLVISFIRFAVKLEWVSKEMKRLAEGLKALAAKMKGEEK